MSSSSKKLEEILKTVRSMDNRVKHLEGEVEQLKDSVFFSKEQGEKIRTQVEKMDSVRLRTMKVISPAEKRMYDLFEDTWCKDGEVVLSRIQEKTSLDYKTVAGYANRLVKYGLLERHWNSARKINVYAVPG